MTHSDHDTVDTFFHAETITESHRPGDVLRARAVIAPQLQAGVASQIVYVSRTPLGESIPVSGMVIIPDTTAMTGPGPVLVYCTSFHGLGGNDSAPSQLLAAGVEPEADRIGDALARGWTVAVSDGQGLGMAGVGAHTWLSGYSAAYTALDIARAASNLPGVDNPDAPIALWGYADGGRAAIWAGQMADEYAPQLDVRGVAAGAVVADPAAVIAGLDGGPWSGLGLAGLIGLGRAYPHLPTGHVLTSAGQAAAAQAARMDAAEILASFPQPLAHWCERPDPWADAIWRYVLTHEGAGRRAPQAPVHLYHGSADTLVPVEQGRALFSSYQLLGVEVSMREYDTHHLRTALDGADEAVARLAGYLQQPARPRPSQT
ncbi:lipase family protein [Nocardia sp. NPDC052566]|uniref:lipase family protein n=1 Tax=Nocardia sp. NPDC052566 TaxID=3364330 RepID=UPI0037C8735E